MSKLDSRVTTAPSVLTPSRTSSPKDKPAPTTSTSAQQRQVLSVLDSAAGANRRAIFKDDFKGSLNMKAEGVAKRTAKINGAKVDVFSMGTLESSARKVGTRLSLEQTLTRAGYDVTKLTQEQKLKLMDALNRKAEVQLGREAGKWLADVAANGKDGTFSTRITAVNGQTYLITAKSDFDDAIRGSDAGSSVGWSDWTDRSVIPGKREVEYTGRDNDRRVFTRWDRAETELRTQKRENKLEPVIEQLKYRALFGDGDEKVRTKVEGLNGAWDVEVEVEKFDFAATRVQPKLFNGDNVDFVLQLVRAARDNEAGKPRSSSAPYQALRDQLVMDSEWTHVATLAKALTFDLPENATREQVQAALAQQAPGSRQLLRKAEKEFFNGQLAAMKFDMIQDAVEGDRDSVKRTFVFGDKKYQLNLKLDFDVEANRYKPPVLNRVLSVVSTVAAIAGGLTIGGAFLLNAANAGGIASTVGGIQAVIGGVSSLATGDFKGFALNLLSAAGSGIFGKGGFQQFARSVSHIAGGVESVVGGKNLLEKLSGVASLAGFALDKQGATKWADSFNTLSKVANLGSAVVQKNALGIFTAAMAVVNGELGKQYNQRELSAMRSMLENAVRSSAIEPLTSAQAASILDNADALHEAISSGTLSVSRSSGWELLTPAKLDQLKTQYGSVDAALSSGGVTFGLQMLPDDVMQALSQSGKPPKNPLFRPLNQLQVRELMEGVASGEIKLEIKDGVRFRGLSGLERAAMIKNADKFNALLKSGAVKASMGGKRLTEKAMLQFISNPTVLRAAEDIARTGYRLDAFQNAVRGGISGPALLEALLMDPRFRVGTTAMLIAGTEVSDPQLQATLGQAVRGLNTRQLQEVLTHGAGIDEVSRFGGPMTGRGLTTANSPMDTASALAWYYRGQPQASTFVNTLMDHVFPTASTGNQRAALAAAGIIASSNTGNTALMDSVLREVWAGRVNEDILTQRHPLAVSFALDSHRNGLPMPLVLAAAREANTDRANPSQQLKTSIANYVDRNLGTVLASPLLNYDPRAANSGSASRVLDNVQAITRLIADRGYFNSAAGIERLIGQSGVFGFVRGSLNFRNEAAALDSAHSVAGVLSVLYEGVRYAQENRPDMLGRVVGAFNDVCTLFGLQKPGVLDVLLDRTSNLTEALQGRANERQYGGNPLNVVHRAIADILSSLNSSASFPQAGRFREQFLREIDTILRLTMSQR